MLGYFDNAATSFPKPVGVVRQIEETVAGKYGNPGRSGHIFSRKSQDAVFSARLAVARFINVSDPANIVFTQNATFAINTVILGAADYLCREKEKPLFVTSVFEHNSVLRPLYRLEREGKIRLLIISPEGEDKTRDLISKMPDDASFIALTALSNTAGDSFDLCKVGEKAHSIGAFFLIDGSQAIGTVPFSLPETLADAVCAPCHKGLLGIMGAGFIAFSDKAKFLPEEVISGGVGNDPKNHFMPFSLPDRFEAGTLAVPAIATVTRGIEYIEKIGIKEIERSESYLKSKVVSALFGMKNVFVYAPENKNGPVLFNVGGIPSHEAAMFLDEEGFSVRAGFHCAPLSHEYYRTGNNGAVRISFGVFNTEKETLALIDKIYALAKK